MMSATKRFATIEARLGMASSLTKMGAKVGKGSKGKEETILLFERQLEKLQKRRPALEADLEVKKAVRVLLYGPAVQSFCTVLLYGLHVQHRSLCRGRPTFQDTTAVCLLVWP